MRKHSHTVCAEDMNHCYSVKTNIEGLGTVKQTTLREWNYHEYCHITVTLILEWRPTLKDSAQGVFYEENTKIISILDHSALTNLCHVK